MSLIQHPINLGTTNDDGTGSNLKAGGTLINQDIAALIASVNAIISTLGMATDTSTNLGTFTGSTIADNTNVKAALQTLETYVEALNVLDPSYVPNATVAYPVASDTLEAAIAKLHKIVLYLDGLDAIRMVAGFSAAGGVFPSTGTGANTNFVQRGDAYEITVAGTINGISLAVGDQLIALVDNPSTTIYANNWLKRDFTNVLASQIALTPAGTVTSTDVQAGINELDSLKTAKATLTTKGDIYAASGAATPVRVAVGADGQALMGDTSAAAGVSYGVQLESRFDQANLTANTTLAASVVNTSNYIAFAQTTANIIATIPNPTVSATKHRTITLCNEGAQTLAIAFASGTGFFLTPSNVMAITWNGTQWVASNAQLAVAPSYARYSRTASQTVANNTDVIFTQQDSQAGSDISVNTSNGQITLKAGKTYHLTGSVTTAVPAPTNRPSFIWFNQNTSAFLGTAQDLYAASDAGANMATAAPATATISPTVDTVVSFRNQTGAGQVTIGGNSDFNLTGSYAYMFIEVIGNYAPILGTTVDYALCQTVDATGFGTGVDVDITSMIAGNMAVDTVANTILLKAGKTYRLTANLRIYANSSDLEYAWVNSANAELTPNFGRGHVAINGATQVGDSFAETVYTPTVDTLVKVRCLTGSTGQFEQRASSITVQQIGSTASTSPQMPTVQRFTSSGTYTPSQGVKYIEVEAIGAGGGASAIAAGGVGTYGTVNAGGSGGTYIKALLTAAQIGASQAVTIGSGVVGGAGGSTTLGSLVTAPGGQVGGQNGTTSSGFSIPAQGAASGSAGTTTGTLVYQSPGQPGGHGWVHVIGSLNISALGGTGGAAGGLNVQGTRSNVAVTTSTNIPNVAGAVNTGAGAAGGCAIDSSGAVSAVAGGSGLLIITEYF